MARSGSYIWITWGWISKIEIEWYFWLYVYFLLIENLFNLICRQRLARLRFASSLRLQRATAPSTTDWNYATLFLVLSGESRKGCQTLCIPFHSRFLPYDLSVFLIPSGTSPRRYGALVLVLLSPIWYEQALDFKTGKNKSWHKMARATELAFLPICSPTLRLIVLHSKAKM